MRKSRYNEAQIVGILKEHQAGLGAAELCRKYGISDATFYKWLSKYGGLEVSEARRLRSLEAENAKLKRLLAEAMLDVSTLKEMVGKTSDAQVQERSGGLGDEGKRALAAAGMWPGGAGSAGVPVPVDPIRRPGAARKAAGVGGGASGFSRNRPKSGTDRRKSFRYG